ncbi:uncharacterized protein LOC117052010 [Lacerta agilis]|uniref:uncharacterized protein LOC117052010 n=1 Tax=Lacerta agilis TaxID=80427 RepID=UPI001419FB59|nr:uncharacterized protein LOC117052010 [Lacerta agilis]
MTVMYLHWWRQYSSGYKLLGNTNYIYISRFFMLLSAVTSYGSVVTGTFCLTPIQPPKWWTTTWPTLTIGLCFVSGFNGAMGLFNYMRAATEMPNTFLSWSLAPGWFSVILATMAGVCHLVAKKWEQDEDTTELFAGMSVKTLKEDLLQNPVSQCALRGRPKGKETRRRNLRDERKLFLIVEVVLAIFFGSPFQTLHCRLEGTQTPL